MNFSKNLICIEIQSQTSSIWVIQLYVGTEDNI